MTNAEKYLQDAIADLEARLLNDFESCFIKTIRDYTKKQLNQLTAKQYNLLRSIALHTTPKSH